MLIARFFFSNEVSDLFGEPVDQRGAGLGLPYQMAEAVLLEYRKLLAMAIDDDSLLASQPDDLCSAFDMVMTACRAIVAVSSPVPGLYESKAADVQAVFLAAGGAVDDDATEELFADFLDSDNDKDKDSAKKPPKTEASDRPGVKHAMHECFERLRTAAYKNDHWKARLAAFPDATAPTVVARAALQKEKRRQRAQWWRELHLRLRPGLCQWDRRPQVAAT